MSTTVERQQLAREHRRLVRQIARKVGAGLPHHVELEDLVQEGMVGLLEALDRFDPAQGVQLTTFLSTRIRGAMLDYLRGIDFASRGARRRLREMQQAEETLTHELGRQPRPDELAGQMKVSRREVERRRFEGVIGFVGSLQEKPPGIETGLSWLDQLADDGPSLEAQAERDFRKEALKKALVRLSERERLLLALYYFEDLKVKEIADVLGISSTRCFQLHRRALDKLRSFMDQAAA